MASYQIIQLPEKIFDRLEARKTHLLIPFACNCSMGLTKFECMSSERKLLLSVELVSHLQYGHACVHYFDKLDYPDMIALSRFMLSMNSKLTTRASVTLLKISYISPSN